MPPPPSPDDAARLALLAGALLAALIAPDGANAFEPGVRMRCEPSADGLSFDCREAGAAPAAASSAPATAPEPAREGRHEPAQTAPLTGPATPIRHASTGTARELPNYLRAAPPVKADAGIDDRRPAAVSAKPRSALRPARDVSSEPAMAPESAPSTTPEPSAASTRSEPSTRTEPPPVAEPRVAPSATTATPPTPAEPITVTPPPAIPSAASPPNPVAQTGDAAAFRRLPARRYTLELWRGTAIPPVTELLDALAAQPGRLYHLEFDADGRHWHSLLWSDFETLEAARAAREALPAQIPANAGFARRIGPLQAELAPRP